MFTAFNLFHLSVKIFICANWLLKSIKSEIVIPDPSFPPLNTNLLSRYDFSCYRHDDFLILLHSQYTLTLESVIIVPLPKTME